MTGDAEVLAAEYAEVAERVRQLRLQEAAAVRERNAILGAMAEAGLTYARMTQLTGLPAWQLRTAIHNDWRARTEESA